MRVHLHAWFYKDVKLDVKSWDTFLFRGSVPFDSPSPVQLRSKSLHAGAYYLQASKCGQVFQEGNVEPFADYTVMPKWIWTMVTSGKLDTATARVHLIRQGENLRRLLPDLKQYEDELKRMDFESHTAAKQLAVGQQMKPQREIPAVTAWMKTYSVGHWLRKKFLVLDGPSGVGKTAFVRSLCGLHATLELNCANAEHINLRDFDAMKHRVVLFDEAPVSLVLAQRKLFQAPPLWIDLGASATAQYVYKVWVNDAVLVICSNSWWAERSKLSWSDHNWITENEVYVYVQDPLWLDSK